MEEVQGGIQLAHQSEGDKALGTAQTTSSEHACPSHHRKQKLQAENSVCTFIILSKEKPAASGDLEATMDTAKASVCAEREEHLHEI